MKTILLPEKGTWDELCIRPQIERENLEGVVRGIINRVISEGDKAIYYFSEKFDGVAPVNLKVLQHEILISDKNIPKDLKDAIRKAKENIESFHSVQLTTDPVIEASGGVRCWRKSVAIEKVRLYIPGGSAPLFSTLLMLGIPAKLAGCNEIIVCTPPRKDGKINPLILHVAHLIGITEIYKAGCAQAIAAT